MRIKRENFISLVIGFFCISLNIYASKYGYGGYDVGLLYGAQNLLSNSNAIHGVPFVLPLLFAALLKLSAWAYGNTFFAPFAASCIVYSIILFVGNLLYARALTKNSALRPVSLILFTSAISINLLNPGHLWHSDLTSMIAIALLWVAYCTTAVKSPAGQVFCYILAALILLCKQNLAPLYFGSYLFYQIVLWRTQKDITQIKLCWRLGWILALSSLIAYCISAYVGIKLGDYYETIRLIGAERGSPFSNAENYLKFATPELLSLESLFSSTREFLSPQSGSKRFAVDIAKLLWITGFYIACLFIPIFSINTGLKQLSKNINRSRFGSDLLLGFLFKGLGISAAIGVISSVFFPLSKRLDIPALGSLLMLLTYLAIIGIGSSIILIFLFYCRHSITENRLRSDFGPLAVLSILFFMVSFVGLGTNWDLKSSDLSVSMMSLFIVADILFEPVRDGKARIARYFYAASTVALMLSGLSSITRARMTLVGPPAELDNRQCRLRPSSFWGTDFMSSAFHCAIDEDVNHQLKRLKSVSATKVFFGPRMEAYYSATSTSTPINLPIWWHPGTSFSSRQANQISARFIDNNFDAIILMRNDFTRMPESVVEYIKSSAFVHIDCSSIDVYIKLQFARPFSTAKVCPSL